MYISEWMGKKMWHIQTMKYYPAIKRRNSSKCYNMDETCGYYTKWNSQSKKDKHSMTLLVWGI